MSWLSTLITRIPWRTLLKEGILLGIPYLLRLLKGKSPTAAQIVEAIVEAILQDRPDLANSPALSAEIRNRLHEAKLPRTLEREAMSYAMRTYGENS